MLWVTYSPDEIERWLMLAKSKERDPALDYYQIEMQDLVASLEETRTVYNELAELDQIFL